MRLSLNPKMRPCALAAAPLVFALFSILPAPAQDQLAGADPDSAFPAASVAQCTPASPTTALKARFKGRYAFEINKAYSTLNYASSFSIGSFYADGNGHLTGGVWDNNSPWNSKGTIHGTFTGTYSIGSDNRGLVVISNKTSAGTVSAATYCIALNSFANGVAKGATMVRDDASGEIDAGTLYAQGATSFAPAALSGSWAFGSQGGNLSKNMFARVVVAGFVTLGVNKSGAGVITNGQTDISGNRFNTTSASSIANSSFHQTGMTGAFTLNSATGRGEMSITVPAGQSGSGTSKSIIYVAGANRILMMQDTTTNIGGPPALVGTALRRTVTTFNDATVKGISVFRSISLTNTNSTAWNKRAVQLGTFDFNGQGTLTVSSDQNDAGTITLASSANTLTKTYSVDANGRATSGKMAFYLVGPNEGFGVEAKVNTNFIYFEPQKLPSGGLTVAGMKGSNGIGTVWHSMITGDSGYIWNGVSTLDGKGNMAETLDWNLDGTPYVNRKYALTYKAPIAGRELGTALVYYWVSAGKVYSMSIKKGDAWAPMTVTVSQ